MEATFNELTPLAELVIEGAVANTQSHSATMDRIQALVKERYHLYQEMARYPFMNIEHAARVRDITRELDGLWEQERRARASARRRLERSMGVPDADTEGSRHRHRVA
jgi:hypothetical protein